MTAPSKLAPSEAVREAIAFAVGTHEYETPESKASFWEHLGGYYKGRHRGSADAALAAIAAQGLVLVPVEQWLPIETAPKDGRWLWVFYPEASLEDRQLVALWDDARDRWVDAADSRDFDQPTHWMPLPNPPAAVKPPAEET